MNRRAFLRNFLAAAAAAIAAPVLARLPADEFGVIAIDSVSESSGMAIMARTNFGAISASETAIWSRNIWQAAPDQAFMSEFVGLPEPVTSQRIYGPSKPRFIINKG